MSLSLPDCLNAFVASANAHPQIGRLLKGWEPLLQIEATDDGQQFHLRIENAKVGAVGLGAGQAEHAILVRGERDVLTRVFTGALNPAQAYLEGSLEVFGNDRDHIKLDAISLVLWGM